MKSTAIFPMMMCTLLALGVTQLLVTYKWIRILREHHPAVWNELGRPTLFGSAGVQLRMWRFAIRGEYKALGDAKLDRLSSIMLRLGGIYIVICSLILIGAIFILT